MQKGWEALGSDDKADEDISDDSEPTGFDLASLKFNDSGVCESGAVDKNLRCHRNTSLNQRYWLR